MKDKMEAMLRVIGELQQFDANTASSEQGTELDTSDLDQIFAAVQNPIHPRTLKLEDT